MKFADNSNLLGLRNIYQLASLHRNGEYLKELFAIIVRQEE